MLSCSVVSFSELPSNAVIEVEYSVVMANILFSSLHEADVRIYFEIKYSK